MTYGNARTLIWSVHPHARGEHVHAPYPIGVLRGSSPRTWGTSHRGHSNKAWGNFARGVGEHKNAFNRFFAVIGSSPRIVGNMWNATRTKNGSSVHPHARGEHQCRHRGDAPSAGSSPRTWGTYERRNLIPRRLRFIPTHVGNMILWFSLPPSLVIPTHGGTWIITLLPLVLTPVHPHARGEHEPV